MSVRGLKKYFPVEAGFMARLFSRKALHVKAVDGVDFEIRKGEVLGLVGESGSGKTTVGRVILRLIEPTEGKVLFDNVDTFGLEGRELRRLRKRMQMIFQDPNASLNPRMKVGDAVGNALDIHGMTSRSNRRRRVLEMLERVGLQPAKTFYSRYPRHLSGGQKQRVVIARALVLNPEFVVADEPVAMVDVSVRAYIMDLMLRLGREMDLTYLLITHDLAVAKYLCDRIAVMYLGKIVEVGTRTEIFRNPQHPYTQALLSAIPIPDPKSRAERQVLRGEIPSPVEPPSGCRFHPRCPYAFDRCPEEEPGFTDLGEGHVAACHLLD